MLNNYSKEISLPFELPTRFYGAMLLIWLINPGLQRRFPLHKNKRKDYLAYLSWCMMIGRQEYKLLSELEQWNHELLSQYKSSTVINDCWNGCYNNAMYLAGVYRARGNPILVTKSKVFRNSIARWFFRRGWPVLHFSNLQDWQQKAIKNKFVSLENFASRVVYKSDIEDEEKSHKTENELASLTSLKKVDAKAKIKQFKPRFIALALNQVSLKSIRYLDWLKKIKRKINPQPLPALNDIRILTASFEENIITDEVSNNSELAISAPFGVNLFGYAKGELGIGEDVRMVAQSLKEADVPFCIVNIELGKNVSQNDSSVDQWVVEKPKYNINIFCMTAIEHARYFAQFGKENIINRYNIGIWPWELPDWPKGWRHAYSLVDEVWGISQFTADAYKGFKGQKTVIPLPVLLGKVSKSERKNWNLPENSYLYVYSFDFNSTLTRKNPEGLLQAFKAAFLDSNTPVEDVGLVLKINHPNPKDPRWQKLKKIIDNESNIYLIEGTLPKEEVLGLYKACDCFVSLHRSEGFGRGIAEAQLLGLDTIATGYSGNLDFCEAPCKLVEYDLVNLQPQDYFLAQGQQWAEPNVNHAALLMLEAYKNRNADKIPYNTYNFSIEACGKFYKNRLKQINATLVHQKTELQNTFELGE